MVSTALPGVVNHLKPQLGPALTLVEPPRMKTVDIPRSEDLPIFVERLTKAMIESLQSGSVVNEPIDLQTFNWKAVFGRVAAIWRSLLDRPD